MNNKKTLVFISFIFLVLVYLLLLFTDSFIGNLFLNTLILCLLFLLGIFVIGLILKNNDSLNLSAKDKLFNSLVKNSNTIYILINSRNKKVIYLSDNVENVLRCNKQNF